MESIREFFDEEIRGRDASTVVLVYKMLFRDISSQSLKISLINKITKFKGNDFEFFHRLACMAVKATTQRQQLEFVFDLFSDFDVEMSILQFDELCKMLQLDQVTKYNLDKDEFVDVFVEENHNFNILQEAKYMFIATMSIKSEGTHLEQQLAILTFLEQAEGMDSGEQVAINLERYIQKNLDKDQTYYLIEKDFWDSWT